MADIVEGDEMKEKGANNRKKLREEIVSTERSYVNGLNVLVDIYLNKIKDEIEGKEDKFGATPEDLRTLRINIETLSKLHQDFYDKLTEAGEVNNSFCEVLTDYMKLMSSCYVPYMTGYGDALDLMTDLKKKNKKFRKFCEEVDFELKGKGENKMLLDYLITPVQRIPRYVLLLAELLKNSSKNHPQYEMMSTTLGGIKKVATEVNEAKRKREALNELIEIAKNVKGVPSSLTLVAPHRTLIRSCALKTKMESFTGAKQSMKQTNRWLFLFSDIIMIAKSDGVTYKSHINVAASKIETEEGNDTRFSIQSNKMYVMFECATKRDRDGWVKDLESNIALLRKNRTQKRQINSRSLRRGKAPVRSSVTNAIQDSLKELNIAESTRESIQ